MQLIGPFDLNFYNGAIMLGLYVMLFLMWRHKTRPAIITTDQLFSIVFEAALLCIIAGRIVHIISNWSDYTSIWQMLSIWNGGLSILGTPLGVGIYALILKKRGIAVLALTDIAALYGPLFHAIGRMGCFLVGCCHGSVTDLPWAVTYTSTSYAPLHCSLHPTQLYSAVLFIVLFIILFILQKKQRPVGELSMCYLMGMSIERGIVDFFRGDRIMHGTISFAQLVSVLIFLSGLVGFVYLRWSATRHHESL